MSDIENASEQLFTADSDLFDAEIDSDTEAIVNKDGGEGEDDINMIENGGNHEEESDEEDPFGDNDNGEEESLEAIKQKAKKIRTSLDVTVSSTRDPKKQKAKKDDVTKLHSESQRLVRESRVKLPYHQPETKDIRHFLKRVQVNNNVNHNKESRNDKPTKPDSVEETTTEPANELESSTPEDLTTTEDNTSNETVAVKPKLTVANDPFFFYDSSSKKPAGLDHLMERFFKHNKSKLKQNVPEEVDEVKEQTETSDVFEVTDEVEKLKTTDIAEKNKSQKMLRPNFKPGDDLRSLKEKLQVNMKLQRAEVRKIHESERKIDNEEISDEEEEEYDDDEDSDFEVDEWNAEDEKAQEERSLEAEELENHETNDTHFNNEESNSIADSDTNHEEFKSQPKLKPPSKNQMFPDEQTIDLFPSDNSNQTVNRTLDEGTSDLESVGSEESIKLRLDSLEDTQDGLTSDQTSMFTKLKMSVNEQSSDASNLPNAQVERSEMKKSSESLDRSSSNDGLTPFSRIQRLLGVDCSSGTRDKKPKPISELTLPVEDSQDLYDEDDVVDKRFSNGLNTSKYFNFALDEDTQFTQFVDTQGYLLSTTKKKKNKDVAKDEQKSNMSELLGLCSGTFSDQPKKSSTTETQPDMSELLGLCSGTFSDAPKNKATTESQDNMNELLGLCSGKFTGEKRENSESKSQNMSELLGLCSGKFGDENPESKSETQNMNELLDLCSGEFTDKNIEESLSETQSTSGLFGGKSNFSLQSESSRKDQTIMNELLRSCSGRFSSVGSTENSGNDRSGESESGIFSEVGKNEKRKPKSKQGLSAMFEKMGDEEDGMDDVVALCSGKFPGSQESKEQTGESENKTADNENSDLEVENSDMAENSNVEENSANSEDEVFSDDERQADSDDEMMVEDEMRKSRKYRITYGKKVHSIFNKDNFVEDEAELSGSEASSDEEERSGDDELEEDSDCEDLPSDEELQRQVNKVHLKSVIDEDKRELRELKERYLEDGDLYSESGGRARNFKWQGLEDSQLDMFDNKVLWGDDEIVDSELLSEAELERRKIKHERDQFLQEQLARSSDSQRTDVDENSQNILNLIKDTSSAADEEQTEKTEKSEKPAPKRQDSTSTKLSQKRGSFLNRSKDQMSRLSSITTMKKTPNSTRGFVFHAISPSSKAKENTGQKLQRSVSLSEPPNPKRPRLDRTLSNIPTGSLFAAMPV